MHLVISNKYLKLKKKLYAQNITLHFITFEKNTIIPNFEQ